MELQIQDLVTSIRKEGIDVANAEAESIIADANKRANAIISEANAEASTIRENSEKQIEILRKSAIVSVEQAKRDAMLAFKKEIQLEFEKILSNKIKNSLNDEMIAKLIKSIIDGEELSKYTVEIANISDTLKSELADKLKEGLEIKLNKHINTGFRISANDGTGYFDCSDDEIMQMLMPYFRNLDF